MNRDVTITISTAGDGTVSVGAPGPNPTDVANAERLAGAPRGPIPTPLDQLPKASGALGDASTGDAGPPAPMEIANLAAAAANAGGQAPPPVDLDLLAPAAARSSARRKPAARKRK